MMIIKPISKIALTLAVMALAVCPASANTGMLEMLILTGARQAAMGETAALSDYDAFNLEYNPATIVGMKMGRLGFSYNSFFQDRTTSTLAAIFPAKGLDLGLHMRLSGTGDIEGRGDTPSSEPDYLFSAHDYAVKFFAAAALMPQLKVGLSAGWLMEKIDIDRGSSLAFGLGAIYDFQNGFATHASAANLGSKFKFIEEENDLPTIYRVGTSFNKNEMMFSADYVNIKSGDGHLHFGGEYLLEKHLFLRGGYQTGYDSRDFSAGVGFVYDYLRIDYAFVPFKSDLGNSHRFTFNILLR